MKKSTNKLWIAASLFIFAFTPSASAQVIEVDAAFGFGGTTDIEAWTGISEDGDTFKLSDWSFFSGYAAANVLFPISKSISVGGSIGYQHLFWYDYDVYDQDGYYSYTEEETVNATRLNFLARYTTGNNFVDLGVGGFIVHDVDENYSAPSILLTFGHFFKVNDKISIPLKINGGIVFEENPILPFTIGTGISYNIK